MRLANLQEFRRLIYTPDSAPSFDTLRDHIKAGQIPGGMVHCGRYYVDLDEFDRATGLRDKAAQQHAELSRTSELDGLL
jgi:hypothetical protein